MPAKIATPFSNSTIYTFKLGSIKLVAISDGQARFPAYPAYAPNATHQEVRSALRSAGLDQELYLLNATALLILTKEETILVDAGAGRALGPGFGRLQTGLSVLGIATSTISTVHITHAHLDHIGGLVDDTGKARFPNAILSMARAEWDYWTNPVLDLSALPIDEGFRASFKSTAQNSLPPYVTRLRLFEEQTELATEVKVIRTGAHTPGHSVVEVKSEGQDLMVVGDLFHHAVFDLAHPQWCTAFDWQPQQMPALRRELLGKAADKQTMVFAYHAPFPGLGRIFRQGEAFRFEALPWLLEA